ncbi:MAG: acetylornithine/N-succinyldiaminopimelate aminotransferase [Verrucomicrobiota bacterium]|jgi:acetylornithine aminotransferase/acetylornithine/N-succinyldiaminopimelate aminotransferase
MKMEMEGDMKTLKVDRLSDIRKLFQRNVVPTYARFDVALDHGEGSYVFDVAGKRYLDLGGGIAVCALGHANPEITDALLEQSRKLLHVSNLYFTKPQAQLAESLVRLIGPGRCFFCNSGAEANEGLYKLARKFGHDTGRYEILTTNGSFHGRTLAGIAATGQEKVQKGFEPMVDGFRQVPFNNLDAMRAAITPKTAAILIESIQGESGITIATSEYLLGLRKLCDERGILLMLDEVQAGHFRTGSFHGWQRVLENVANDPRSQVALGNAPADFSPDAISMAKSLGGGFPIGAFWVREQYADLLSAGTHATTFGGNPLGCAVALKVLEVIERDQLADNAREIGRFISDELQRLIRKFPTVLKEVRGFGLMIGLEFREDAPGFRGSEKAPSLQVVERLHAAGVLTVPAGTSVIRLLPALNLTRPEAMEGLRAIESVVAELASAP